MTWESPLSAPEVRQLQAILDNDPVAIFVSDVESRRVLYANRRAAGDAPTAGRRRGLLLPHRRATSPPAPSATRVE